MNFFENTSASLSRRAFLGASALSAAALLAACKKKDSDGAQGGSSDTDSKFRTLDDIKKAGTVNIGVFSDKAPFGYVDANGNYAGYDIVFAERLAKDMGVKINYIATDGQNRVPFLQSNKADIMLANFTVTDDRKEKVDFSLPYMKIKLGVVSPSSAPITDVSQLDGKKLIVSKGTTAEVWFAKNAPKVELVKFDSYADAYNALLDGRGDCSTAAAMLSQPIIPRYLHGSSLTLALLLALMTWATPILLPLQFTRVTLRYWSLSTTRLPVLLQRRTSSTRLMKRHLLQFTATR